ncbi:MAG: hypothetical protein L6277_12145 [Desulfobacterales bacterium]|nr:hypothetical protein [Pseudomonadota bacterium]MBU4355015.1 hypothetical protein [Pseudomonadota bacterium]MCG2772823.1 hypothetical protein [Desulfobacterales bacterium]
MQKIISGKKTLPVTGPAQKFSYEKFFWYLDDGGHSDKVGKSLKAPSNGRWGPSSLSARPYTRSGTTGSTGKGGKPSRIIAGESG